jgi:hypothetical protein
VIEATGDPEDTIMNQYTLEIKEHLRKKIKRPEHPKSWQLE